jgi:hypothetical protein
MNRRSEPGLDEKKRNQAYRRRHDAAHDSSNGLSRPELGESDLREEKKIGTSPLAMTPLKITQKACLDKSWRRPI